MSTVASGHSGHAAEPPRATNARLYSPESPFATTDFARRSGVLAEIDSYARGRDSRVVQVMASLLGEWQRCRSSAPVGRGWPTCGRWCG